MADPLPARRSPDRSADVVEIVGENRRRVDRAIAAGHGRELADVLEAAEDDLRRRLEVARAAGLMERWTGVQLDTTRMLVRDAVEHAKEGLGDILRNRSSGLVDGAARDVADLLRAQEAKFAEVVHELAIEDALRMDHRLRGVKASLLRQHATSVDRYGSAMIGDFERIMQVGLVNRLSADDVIRSLVGHAGPRGRVSLSARALPDGSVVRLREGDAPEGLFRQRRYWAERIVRTELMTAYNAGTQASLEEEEATDFPDLKRMILSTFDRRTGEDSVFVHGEIRGVREPFTDGAGRVYLYPPARPNDRERIVPWREAWGLPPLEFLPRPEGARKDAAEEAGGTEANEHGIQSSLVREQGEAEARVGLDDSRQRERELRAQLAAMARGRFAWRGRIS